jgi:CheY-like chemotaxis protein
MKKILVVDDEPDMQFLYRQKFRREVQSGELDFHFALNGKQALDYMSGLNPFDLVLVLSDINMPEMNGLELLRRSKEAYPSLPVIMVTAYGDDGNNEESKKLGANDFITKPVDFNLLRTRING